MRRPILVALGLSLWAWLAPMLGLGPREGPEPPLPRVLDSLDSGALLRRRRALDALPGLRPATQDEVRRLGVAAQARGRPRLRESALQALASGDEFVDPAPTCLRALEDPFLPVRVAGLRYCGRARVREALPLVRKLLHAQPPRRREEAARRGSGDFGPVVVLRAAEYLARVGDFESFEGLLGRGDFAAGGLESGLALAELGARALPRAVELAHGRDPFLADVGRGIVLGMNDPSAAAALRSLRADPDRVLALAAEKALARLEPKGGRAR